MTPGGGLPTSGHPQSGGSGLDPGGSPRSPRPDPSQASPPSPPGVATPAPLDPSAGKLHFPSSLPNPLNGPL